MPYQVLARKYRPLRFSDVAGQDHVTRTLQNALEQGRVAHGYIFSGHRGIGKTTIARILASALNCQRAIGSSERPTPEPCLTCDSCREIRQGNAVDVIEIDAATNRGIDEIRELRDAARYQPARDRFKIIILDEAHQITDAAFNALLKTLEEPPEHIVFMMATTEPENIPQTIRSRCQHFSFHAVKLDDILGQLRKIAVDENVIADDAALDLLAEAGDGSMRDALSIMDQAIASAPTVQQDGIAKAQLSAQEIRDLMGTVPNTVFEEILEHVSANSAAGVLTTANRLLDAGNSPSQIARQFVRYLRNTVVAKIANLTPDSPDTELLQISPDERRRAARTAMLFTEEELTRFMQVMLRTFDDLGFRQEQRFHLELGLLKLVHLQRLLPMEQFLSQLPRPDGTRRLPTPPRSASSQTAAPIHAAATTPAPRSPVAGGATTAQTPPNVDQASAPGAQAQPATATINASTAQAPSKADPASAPSAQAQPATATTTTPTAQAPSKADPASAPNAQAQPATATTTAPTAQASPATLTPAATPPPAQQQQGASNVTATSASTSEPEGAGAFRPLNSTQNEMGFSPGEHSSELGPDSSAPPPAQPKVGPRAQASFPESQNASAPADPPSTDLSPRLQNADLNCPPAADSTPAQKPASRTMEPQADPAPAHSAVFNPFGSSGAANAPKSSPTAASPSSSAFADEPSFRPAITSPRQSGASDPVEKLHSVPALAQPNSSTAPDPSTGIDPHLPPIDSYELDAIAATASDEEMPPPPAPDPEAQPAPAAGDAAVLQAAAVEALFSAGSQNSAAEQLEETTWTLGEGEIRIQTSLSKMLMGTIFRADTQAIVRGAVAKAGGVGLKLNFLPGSVADKAKAAPKKPRTGSAQAKALEHPTVQAAQRLFNAEVTNVFDLRKD